MADQLWFMTCIREEEEEDYLCSHYKQYASINSNRLKNRPKWSEETRQIAVSNLEQTTATISKHA